MPASAGAPGPRRLDRPATSPLRWAPTEPAGPPNVVTAGSSTIGVGMTGQVTGPGGGPAGREIQVASKNTRKPRGARSRSAKLSLTVQPGPVSTSASTTEGGTPGRRVS